MGGELKRADDTRSTPEKLGDSRLGRVLRSIEELPEIDKDIIAEHLHGSMVDEEAQRFASWPGAFRYAAQTALRFLGVYLVVLPLLFLFANLHLGLGGMISGVFFGITIALFLGAIIFPLTAITIHFNRGQIRAWKRLPLSFEQAEVDLPFDECLRVAREVVLGTSGLRILEDDPQRGFIKGEQKPSFGSSGEIVCIRVEQLGDTRSAVRVSCKNIYVSQAFASRYKKYPAKLISRIQQACESHRLIKEHLG